MGVGIIGVKRFHRGSVRKIKDEEAADHGAFVLREEGPRRKDRGGFLRVGEVRLPRLLAERCGVGLIPAFEQIGHG